MSDDPETTTDADEIDVVLDELNTSAYNSTVKVLNYLIAYYVQKTGSDYLVRNQLLIVLTTIAGQMLSDIPSEHRERTLDKCLDHIRYTLDMSETESVPETDTGEVKEIKKYDLATMKPQGNC